MLAAQMQELSVLVATAASIGVVHTLIGPDHYVPFAAMAAARRWSLGKTLAVTAACGAGHVLGSLALGVVGLGLGASLAGLVDVEAARGAVAGWLLLGLGLAYFAWGLRQAWRRRPHAHAHVHADGTRHEHGHGHGAGHVHVHDEGLRSATPWALFVVFVFGPCEALVPLLMVPAAEQRWATAAAVVGAFAAATIGTMLLVVWLLARGLARAGLAEWSRFGHATAGAAICACALAMLVLGA